MFYTFVSIYIKPKRLKNGHKPLKSYKNEVRTLKTKMSLLKCLKNLIKSKNRHLVNVNLGQQDKRSMLRQL